VAPASSALHDRPGLSKAAAAGPLHLLSTPAEARGLGPPSGPARGAQGQPGRWRAPRLPRRLAPAPDKGGRHGRRARASDGSSHAIAAASLKARPARARAPGGPGRRPAERPRRTACRPPGPPPRASPSTRGAARSQALHGSRRRSKACAHASVFLESGGDGLRGRPRPGHSRARRSSALRAPITRA